MIILPNNYYGKLFTVTTSDDKVIENCKVQEDPNRKPYAFDSSQGTILFVDVKTYEENGTEIHQENIIIF